MAAILHLLAGLLLAPLLPGIVARTKALAGGRRGQPLLQLYYDLARLLRKGAVYSRTTTALFRIAPSLVLASTAGAALLLPLGNESAVFSFAGDFVLFALLLAIGRFAMTTAALDTGSAFEGMGASREVSFASLTEPVLFLALAALARTEHSLSLSGILPALPAGATLPEALLVCGALFGVLLTENARIPVDDPTTHLELTMIHEAMILDHSGPDLAFLEYAAALKLWVFTALLAGVAIPSAGLPTWGAILAWFGCIAAICIAVGIVESTMARLRLLRVPQFILGAGALSLFSLFLALR